MVDGRVVPCEIVVNLCIILRVVLGDSRSVVVFLLSKYIIFSFPQVSLVN